MTVFEIRRLREREIVVLFTDMCQDPKKFFESGSTRSNVPDLEGPWILHFHFCRGILGILDLAAVALSGFLGILNLRNLESQTEQCRWFM